MKSDLYCKHDLYATNDPKVKKMMRRFGAAGYGIFWITVELLYLEDGKPWSFSDLCDEVAETSRTRRNTVSDIISFACSEECGLFAFDEENKYVSSRRVGEEVSAQKSYRQKQKEAAEKRWNNTSNCTATNNDNNNTQPKLYSGNASAMPTHNNGNADAMRTQCGPNATNTKSSITPLKGVNALSAHAREGSGLDGQPSPAAPNQEKSQPEDAPPFDPDATTLCGPKQDIPVRSGAMIDMLAAYGSATFMRDVQRLSRHLEQHPDDRQLLPTDATEVLLDMLRDGMPPGDALCLEAETGRLPSRPEKQPQPHNACPQCGAPLEDDICPVCRIEAHYDADVRDWRIAPLVPEDIAKAITGKGIRGGTP